MSIHAFCKSSINLLALTIFLSNQLSAQKMQVSNMPPLSIKALSDNRDTLYTVSEFKDVKATDLLPKRLFTIDTIDVPKIEDTQTPATNGSKAPQNEEEEAPKSDLYVVENVVEKPFYQDSACVDLTFDSVTIGQITDKYVEIEYSIINKGNAPASIFGEKRSNSDNVAVHFYYSGTPRLTRGAILADGIYLTEGLRETKGMLMPNAVYKRHLA